MSLNRATYLTAVLRGLLSFLPMYIGCQDEPDSPSEEVQCVDIITEADCVASHCYNVMGQKLDAEGCWESEDTFMTCQDHYPCPDPKLAFTRNPETGERYLLYACVPPGWPTQAELECGLSENLGYCSD